MEAGHSKVVRCLLALAATAGACAPEDFAAESTNAEETESAYDDGLHSKALAACPVFDAPTSVGTAQAGALTQASGLVSSRSNAGVIWSHNDRGDPGAKIFAMTEGGSLVATVNITNASFVDWEDMATGPAASGSHLYIADFGDNEKVRDQYQIYRLAEPSVSANQRGLALNVTAARMDFQYPAGVGSRNAEVLLADPLSGELFVVTKGDGTKVYSLGQFTTSEVRTGVQIGQINKAAGGFDTAVGGAISPDGAEIVIKGYSTAGKLWRRPSGGSVSDAFLTPPCSAPMPTEPQGEAVAFAADGRGYLTLGEGVSQPIYLARRRGAAPLHEAEARTAFSGCTVATNYAGFTGTGFVDFGGNGTWMEWNNIAAAQAGTYELTFRYANGSSTSRGAAIRINGQAAGNTTFASGGTWTTWKTETITAVLQQGHNTIRVTANQSVGGPNLDNVVVKVRP